MSNLKDLFTKKLNEQQFEVKPQYWNDMEQLLDKKKPKGFWFLNKKLLSAVALLILAGGTAAWLYTSKNNEKEIELVSSQTNRIQNSNNRNANENKLTNDYNTEAESENKLSNTESSATEKKIKNSSGINNNTEAKSVRQTTQKTNSVLNKQGKQTSKTSAAENKSTIQSINTSLINEINNPASAMTETSPSSMFPVLSRIFINSLDNALPFFENRKGLALTVAPNTNSLRIKPRFYAGIYGGIMYSDKTLKAMGNTSEEYISRRNAEEKGNFSCNTGLDIGFTYGKWFFGSGINYHQQSEITNYKNEFRQWVNHDSTYWNIDDNSYYEVTTTDYWLLTDSNYWVTGDTTITYWNENTNSLETIIVPSQTYVVNGIDTLFVHSTDSVYIQQMDSILMSINDSILQTVTDQLYQRKNKINKISYIEIPLLIGYEFPLGKISLTAKTGIGIGILSTQNISYLRTDISAVEKYNITVSNKLMWNYLLRVGANYYLSKHIALELESMFRANLNNAFARQVEFQQKYWNVGLNLGVSYRF